MNNVERIRSKLLSSDLQAVLITLKSAFLFTDSRYIEAAQKTVADNITLRLFGAGKRLSQLIKAELDNEKIEKIARYFALKKHVPSSQEALDYIAVFKTPYRLYKPLCNIANVASLIGFLLFLFVALFIPEGWLNAFSVVYSLFLYFVATSFLFQYFMSLRFNSASFAAVALTKHYLGIIDLNSKK